MPPAGIDHTKLNLVRPSPGNLLKFSTLVLQLFKDLLEYYSCMYSGTALVLSLVQLYMYTSTI